MPDRVKPIACVYDPGDGRVYAGAGIASDDVPMTAFDNRDLDPATMHGHGGLQRAMDSLPSRVRNGEQLISASDMSHAICAFINALSEG